jgi:putative glycosyltransferase (TIGR04372 family)
MLDRSVRANRFARWPYWINQRIPGGQIHSIPRITNRDIHDYFSKTPVQLSLSEEDEQKGRSFLEGLGIGVDTPFICFVARDTAFLDTAHPAYDWHYHDYRNSSIRGHLLAVEEMTRRGNFAFRMGSIVAEPLESTNPMIIDFATKCRTEFLDIYLSAKCRFFISTLTGIDAVASVSRRPMAYVNFCPLEDAPTWSQDDLFIPKKHWLIKEGRYMTFREIIESGASRTHTTDDFNRLGISLVDDTPEEIAALVTEMDDRLSGTWVGAPEDDDLQARYWSMFKPDWHNGVFRAHIGAEFLRQSQDLLD